MKKVYLLCLLLLALFSVSVSAQEKTAESLVADGMAKIDDSDFKGALESFKAALKLKPAFGSALYEAAFVSNELEAYQDALDYLNQYKPSAKKDIAKKFNEVGYAQKNLGNSNDALAAYTKVLETDPKNGPGLRGLGDLYYEDLNDNAKAIDSYEKAVQYDEENSQAVYYRLGWLYNDEDKFDEAIDVLHKAEDNDAEDAAVKEELGYAFYRQKNYDDALSALDSAIGLNPQSKLGFFYKGLCYIDLEDQENALDTLKKLNVVNAEQGKKLQAKIDEKWPAQP